MEKFREYIRAHRRAASTNYLEPTDQQRRDAATTLAKEAVVPLASNPALRQLLIKVHQASEQVIDVITRDRVLFAGASQQTTQNAEDVTKSFRDYIERHKAEITALQLLYSRPYRHRLTERMLKELEKKLREEHAAWTEDRLWDAFAAVAPQKVKGRSQAGRFADLVALVRFTLEQQSLLQPFAQSVSERFNEWLAKKQSGSGVPPLGPNEDRRRDASATFEDSYETGANFSNASSSSAARNGAARGNTKSPPQPIPPISHRFSMAGCGQASNSFQREFNTGLQPRRTKIQPVFQSCGWETFKTVNLISIN